MKTVLVRSLCSMVSIEQRRKARQFLLGLSTDELQYIAEFLGSCILESEQPSRWTRAQLNRGIHRFDQCQKNSVSDRQHKMILLVEFLRRCDIGSGSVAARAELG
jgi:hypothetical protein